MTTKRGRLSVRAGGASTPLESWLLSVIRQRNHIADDEASTNTEAMVRLQARDWLQDFVRQHVELLREKLARTKGPTVTDEQISDALKKYGTQERAAANLGITARAIRKRKAAKKRNR